MRRVLARRSSSCAGAARLRADRRPARRRTTAGNQFTVELDNAFGLVKRRRRQGRRRARGQDRRAAPRQEDAQRAGRLQDRPRRASARCARTCTCESRPQSLIGEYFIDCTPGKSAQKLKPGATIPVEHTASTIPADLLANVMRRPYRERLRIILDELGAGVGGRADDLNDDDPPRQPGAARDRQGARRSSRARTRSLKNLTSNADVVIGDLADNRKDVGRFVKETEDVATASAERRRDIAAGLQRLPTFLRELRPTMAELGAAADASTPVLRDLNASAGQLTRFLDDLGPFAESSRAATCARSPRPPTRRGPRSRPPRPTVAELHQDDRARARARQQPRDRPRGPRRPQPRGREGQALAGRPGLHGLRGGPPVRLRPDAGHQHLRRERPHPQGQPLRRRSAATTRTPTRVKRKEQQEPGFTQPLPRRARPEPAGRHHRRPVRHRRRRRRRAEPAARPRRRSASPRRAKANGHEQERAGPAGPQEGAREAAQGRRRREQAAVPPLPNVKVPNVPLPSVPTPPQRPERRAAPAARRRIPRPSSTTCSAHERPRRVIRVRQPRPRRAR